MSTIHEKVEDKEDALLRRLFHHQCVLFRND